ncbi:MAG: methyltransferase domain-containing protein [Clostridioides difficile]|nr:methyltransferase domain-containing protein [Clostridioides difficile]
MLTTVKRLYPNTSMYGIDISEEMLKKAKEKVLDTVTLSLGDAEHLPFENGKFDCLLCTDSFLPIRQAMNIFIPFSNEGDVRIYSKSEIINFLEANGFQDIQYRNINKSGYLVIAKK